MERSNRRVLVGKVVSDKIEFMFTIKHFNKFSTDNVFYVFWT